MKKLNILYISILIIIVVVTAWAFISAGVITKDFHRKILSEDTENKEVNIESLYVTETKDNEKLWELYAEEGHYDNTNNIIFLSDIIGNFYENEQVSVSFKAKRGTYTSDNKHIILYDDVVFVHKSGANISADRITWKGKEEDITAVGNVRVEKPHEVIVHGAEAVLKSDLSDFKIKGRTKTIFYL